MKDARSTLSRRQLAAGAGTVGALAAVAAVLPRQAAQPQPVAAAKPVPDQGAGYQETPHVLHYYRTARV